MKSQPPRENPPLFASPAGVVLAGAVIAVATLAAYQGSFPAPFLLDDVPGIQNNLTIRHLWPIGRVLSPPPGLTTSGRPMVNLSLAINYASGGTALYGYHALNLAIHILASLVLFGIVRRTLLRRATAGSPGASPSRPSPAAVATVLGLATTLIWALHPLQTGAVTYIIQRAESMMGLFYLLTLYCFIRGVGAEEIFGSPSTGSGHSTSSGMARHERRPKAGVEWLLASALCCLLGMATKEVMVSAPLMVLFYDRTFVAGTFREALGRRRLFYAGLASTWILLACLVVSVGGNRNGSVGFGLGLNWWAYELTQFQAIAHYLWLSVWPHPLVFDYGPFSIKHAGDVLPQAAIVVLLAAGTLVGVWRRTALGFAGAWFFAILAPTSMMPGPTDMIDEHRMYLALTAVVASLVMGLHSLLGGMTTPRRSLRAAVPVLIFAVAVPLGLLTARRNEDYRSELAIWSDTVTKRPENPMAHNSLGNALEHAGRLEEAITQHRQALRLLDFSYAHYSLGNVLTRLGRFPEAIEQYEQALRLRPNQADTYASLGHALFQTGRVDEAIIRYEQALQLNPDDAHAHYGLGMALVKLGRPTEAIEHYQAALQFEPSNALLHYEIGTTLAHAGRLPEAIEHYQAALRLDPHNVAAHVNLGISLAECGRREEAVGHYQTALRLDPNSAEAHLNLGNVWFSQGRLNEAIAQCREALRIKPDYVDAHYNLGIALIQTGRLAEAAEQFKELVQLNPNDVQAQRILARLQAYPQTPGPVK